MHPTTKQCNYSYTHPSSIQCIASTEINSLKSSVSNGKTLIANAITGKGVTTSSSATFATMANNINSLITISSSHASSIIGHLSFSNSATSSYTVPNEHRNSPIYVYMIATNSNTGRIYINVLYQVNPRINEIFNDYDTEVSMSYTRSTGVLTVTAQENIRLRGRVIV